MAQVMPQLLKDDAQEDKGENARLQYFVGAIALGDLVKTTLGPRGMDKILQPMRMEGACTRPTITNDGATILKSLWLDNPAAKILADVSMQQDAQCGDGTTGVVVLAAEMLRNAEQLVAQKIHPQVICRGYRAAYEAARKALDSSAFDNSKDQEKFKADLLKIASTTLSSKLLVHEKDHFSSLAVEAVLRLKADCTNMDLIQVIKKPGATLRESYLEEGFLLQKKIGAGQPQSLKNAKVLVANTPMDTDKVKIYGAKVNVDSFNAVRDIENAEKEKMKTKVNKILAHGCNVFINRQLIYNYPDQLFKNAGVMAIEHSDFDGMERLAKVLGADIASTFDDPSSTKLGGCDMIDQVLIGEDQLIRFSGCHRREACSIVLRGSSLHILDEAERSLHDALAVLSQTIKETRVVYGGGCVEMAMANAVDEAAKHVDGKESIAMEAYAKALRQIPTIILDNAGFDSAEIVARLRAAHHKAVQGINVSGIDIEQGSVGSMDSLGILESYKSKLSQLSSATEAAEMIIRVDEIIKCAPRERQGV